MTGSWQHIDDDECRHFQSAVELIGRRWNSAILLALARGATRFGEIRGMIPGLSDRMLAERMRELQAADLVQREVVPTTPVQIRYQLTERGADLIRSLQPLVKWGHRWQGPDQQAADSA
jgi:DNA-binding HxlR family transcriptional regulator